MFCENCGTNNNEGARFCLGCGQPMQTPPVPENNQSKSQDMWSQSQLSPFEKDLPPAHPKKKKGKGCLIAFVIIAVLFIIAIIGVFVSVNDELDTNAKENPSLAISIEEQQARWLEFDQQSWNDYVELYKVHNNLMNAVAIYSDGNANILEFYNYCEKAESYFSKASITYDYGINDEEKKYLSAFQSLALFDQMASKYLIAYLDFEKLEDLSKAEENIKKAKETAVLIAGNRGALLGKTGLSQDEIKKKIEEDMLALEYE